jgi:triacylglycerol esterase/lipase EstA (alpha/beta hydrolase family)
MPTKSLPQHSPRYLRDPGGWVLYLSHKQPKRLVVFVHGFGGKAVSTWQRFPDGGSKKQWWREADLLFVRYNSKRDNITGTAHRVARELGRFYPQLPNDLLEVDGVGVRASAESRYNELVVVGHSLGGVVVRRAF